MTNDLDLFADAAKEFCKWCEASEVVRGSKAPNALRHLEKLHSLALGLTLQEDAAAADVSEETDDKKWHAVFARCSSLPFSYYSVVFAPSDLDTDEPATGDLRDDIADIYRDVARGLSFYENGRSAEAEWHWCFNFQIHWGRHAVSALHALHCWIADTGGWQPQPSNESFNLTKKC